MKPVPSELEVRKYFNQIHRHPDDKELVYPLTKPKEKPRVKRKP